MTITIYEAVNFFARFYGWHRFPYKKQVLYLPRCQSVHGFGLKSSLWVLFVDKDGKALGAWRKLKPNKVLWHFGAYGVLESMVLSQEKSRSIEAALNASGLTETKAIRVCFFGQVRCDK